MNRSTFLSQLRAGLAGLPQQDADEIVRDYEAHFVEGAAAGRSEDDIAEALGDPGRLARELRAEAGLRKWETRRSPENFIGAVFALIGLAAVDFIFLLPFLFVLVLVALALGLALSAISISGLVLLGGAWWPDSFFSLGTVMPRLFAGIGLLAGGVGGGAALLLTLEAILKILTKYARLHYRLLKIADESS